jgi:hypothetical protein
MKSKIILLLIFLIGATTTVSAQLSPETMAKREKRKNLVVKEWNNDPGTQSRRLDRITTYDDQGRKIEEIEYASYGQKWRSTYEYYPSGKISQEVEYDDRNKPKLIKKYEYNEDGTKKKQYNYNPNGKLVILKNFEYIFQDAPKSSGVSEDIEETTTTESEQ